MTTNYSLIVHSRYSRIVSFSFFFSPVFRSFNFIAHSKNCASSSLCRCFLWYYVDLPILAASVYSVHILWNVTLQPHSRTFIYLCNSASCYWRIVPCLLAVCNKVFIAQKTKEGRSLHSITHPCSSNLFRLRSRAWETFFFFRFTIFIFYFFPGVGSRIRPCPLRPLRSQFSFPFVRCSCQRSAQTSTQSALLGGKCFQFFDAHFRYSTGGFLTIAWHNFIVSKYVLSLPFSCRQLVSSSMFVFRI